MRVDTALWMMVLCLPSVFCASRHMARTADVYCAGSDTSVGAKISARHCSMACLASVGCVAMSFRADGQCVLHGAFCSPGDLLAEPTAVYAEVSWECVGQSCYSVRTLETPKTKSQADAVCASMGAHVAAPETAEECDVIRTLAYLSAYYPAPGTNGNRGQWIDLINDNTWAHSGQPVTYANWGTNEPYGAGEECTIAANQPTISDVACTRVYGFLCEKECNGDC